MSGAGVTLNKGCVRGNTKEEERSWVFLSGAQQNIRQVSAPKSRTQHHHDLELSFLHFLCDLLPPPKVHHPLPQELCLHWRNPAISGQ